MKLKIDDLIKSGNAFNHSESFIKNKLTNTVYVYSDYSGWINILTIMRR